MGSGRSRVLLWVCLALLATFLAPLAIHVLVVTDYRHNLKIEQDCEKLVGRCTWTRGKPPWPLSSLGEKYCNLYSRICRVTFLGGADDSDFAQVSDSLQSLSGLEELDFAHARITDAALARLSGFTALKGLNPTTRDFTAEAAENAENGR